MTQVDHVLNEVLATVADERDRQEEMKAQGKFRYTCADHEMTHADCLAVLTEEVGEVARAVLNINRLTSDRGDVTALREELVQVAAVAVAWVEGLWTAPRLADNE
jgi:NTP pyrophosphatase (non-canonical NTP hydrolase)